MTEDAKSIVQCVLMDLTFTIIDYFQRLMVCNEFEVVTAQKGVKMFDGPYNS